MTHMDNVTKDIQLLSNLPVLCFLLLAIYFRVPDVLDA